MSQELMQQLGESATAVLTFVLFAWIMAKFVWPVIIRILDERSRAIEDGFAQIDAKRREAEKVLKDYEAKLDDIEAEARGRIQEAVAEGRRVADEVTEKARREALEITERAQRNIQIEMDKARLALRNEVISMTLSASERLLREKMDEKADGRLVSTFIEQLESKPS